MNYIAFVYSILLLFSTYFAYKKKIGSSKISLIVSLFLFFPNPSEFIFLQFFTESFNIYTFNFNLSKFFP